MRIEWTYKREFICLGHGVEIFHAHCGPTGQVPPVAFLEGFTWLKGKPEKVKVSVLVPDSQLFL